MEFVEYPFSVNGVNFVSRIAVEGSMYPMVVNAGRDTFMSMNISAINELMGDPARLTKSEIKVRLYDLNAGATQALIELA